MTTTAVTIGKSSTIHLARVHTFPTGRQQLFLLCGPSRPMTAAAGTVATCSRCATAAA